MRMVIIELLGVEEGKLLTIAREVPGNRMEVVYYSIKTTDTAELIERGKDAEVIVVSNLPLNVQVAERCRNLKLLAVAFTSVDHIAMGVCRKNGVMVCNYAGYSTCVVADLMFDILISLYRSVIPYDRVYREEGTKDGLMGPELEGKTFSVVGAGAIGPHVATIAQTFGCRVLAYSRIARDAFGVHYVDLEILLVECDVVSFHTLLTEETRGPMNEGHVGLMKKNTVLVNTARGPVVGSDAPAEALKKGRIVGAYINVPGNEPPVRRGHPLFSALGTIMIPHVAFATREVLIKRAVIVFDNVASYLDETPGNVIG